jgi:acetolactate synthase-1/2/3 large subunit
MKRTKYDGKTLKKTKLSGAEAVAKTMKECGVDYFFYMMGGMPPIMYEEIKKAGVNTILCRSEMAATNMADGYSRVTKRPSVCYAQHGTAAAMLASLLYEPMFAHSPVVALTGSIPTTTKHQWTYQELYEMKYFEETCKFNVDVTDVSRLADYVRIAIQIAVSGCPGPTHVNMHIDMATAVAEMPEIFGDKTFFFVPPFRPRAEPERILKAIEVLGSAENPVMVCGSGVHWSGAYEEVKELAELLTIPVVTNYGGKGCFPEEHPLYVGVMGSYGTTVANEIVREADVVFFVGNRAGRHQTEELTAPIPGTSKIIHLDIDPGVIGRNYRTEVALVGDAKATLRDLLTAFRTKLAKSSLREPRLKEIAKKIKEYEDKVTPFVTSDAIPIKPQRLVKEISKFLNPRDIVVSDTGQMLCWTVRFLKLKGIGAFIAVGGTLGASFAMAIGASFGAKKSQRVLNLIGDGGITYNVAELETAKRYNDMHVPFVAVVNNNSSLGMGRPFSEDWTRKKPFRMSYCDFTELNYAKIAEAFGCYGVRVERPGEILDSLRQAFNSGKPAIIDVVTDVREYAPVGLLRSDKRLYPFYY